MTNKVDLYSQIKHRVEQENHMEAHRAMWSAQQKSLNNQKWYWLGTLLATVILGVAALYFK